MTKKVEKTVEELKALANKTAREDIESLGRRKVPVSAADDFKKAYDESQIRVEKPQSFADMIKDAHAKLHPLQAALDEILAKSRPFYNLMQQTLKSPELQKWADGLRQYQEREAAWRTPVVKREVQVSVYNHPEFDAEQPEVFEAERYATLPEWVQEAVRERIEGKHE